MIKVTISKANKADKAAAAAFSIVKDVVERSLKKFDADVREQGGSVEVKITGPGTMDVTMNEVSPALRRKISSAVKKLSK